MFNSDVDNYIGAKNISNFIIASINDTDEKVDNYYPEYSAGII